jgi:plasmid stabilization system protein ParE
MLGHVVPEYNSPSIRQILEGNYRIIHRVRQDRIEVLAVIHGARELPPVDSLA